MTPRLARGAGLLTGVVLGLSTGFLFGQFIFDNVPLCLLVGAGAGLALGASLEAANRRPE